MTRRRIKGSVRGLIPSTMLLKYCVNTTNQHTSYHLRKGLAEGLLIKQEHPNPPIKAVVPFKEDQHHHHRFHAFPSLAVAFIVNLDIYSCYRSPYCLPGGIFVGLVW